MGTDDVIVGNSTSYPSPRYIFFRIMFNRLESGDEASRIRSADVIHWKAG
jgi:hypothetical protein